MTRRSLTVVIMACVMVSSVATGALAQASAPAGSPAPLDAAAARGWCEAKGGQVQVHGAYFGTNDDRSTWIDLGRTAELCAFEAADETRIYVDTFTLATPTPTLASVAYLVGIPMAEYDPSRGDPATAYCSDLGGSSAFGPGASGGGWVALDDPDADVIALCVFADGSMIEDWGLAYHSDGKVRGADLAPLFGWTGHDSLPPVFG